MTTRAFRPRPPHGGFSIALAVWSPPEEAELQRHTTSPAMRHEAIVSAARAVFALGGELVVAADPNVVPLIAAVALDYAPAPSAERMEAPRTPLTVLETAWHDDTLRTLLAPYAAHDAVTYLGPDGERVEFGRDWASRSIGTQGARQPLLLRGVRAQRTRGAIFVSAPAEAEREIDAFEKSGIPVAVLLSTVADRDLAGRWRHLDPTERLVGDLRRDRWSERADEPRGRSPDVMPFAFTLQRIVGEWVEGLFE
jgi:hypothetical protein